MQELILKEKRITLFGHLLTAIFALVFIGAFEFSMIKYYTIPSSFNVGNQVIVSDLPKPNFIVYCFFVILTIACIVSLFYAFIITIRLIKPTKLIISNNGIYYSPLKSFIPWNLIDEIKLIELKKEMKAFKYVSWLAFLINCISYINFRSITSSKAPEFPAIISKHKKEIIKNANPLEKIKMSLWKGNIIRIDCECISMEPDQIVQILKKYSDEVL